MERADLRSDLLAEALLLGSFGFPLGYQGSPLLVKIHQPIDVDIDALGASAAAKNIGVLAKEFQVDHRRGIVQQNA